MSVPIAEVVDRFLADPESEYASALAESITYRQLFLHALGLLHDAQLQIDKLQLALRHLSGAAERPQGDESADA